MDIFRLSLQQNNTYAFRGRPVLTEYQKIHEPIVPAFSGEVRTDVRRCDKCGELLAKWDESLLGVAIVKRQFDLSITYDGIVIASNAFKTCYDQNHLVGLLFGLLPDDREFLSVRATKSVPFDGDRRKTRFIKQCAQCGQYESVVGATPVFLKDSAQIDPVEFVRTDLDFGSGDSKHPVLLCGADAARALREAKLTGLEVVKL